MRNFLIGAICGLVVSALGFSLFGKREETTEVAKMERCAPVTPDSASTPTALTSDKALKPTGMVPTPTPAPETAVAKTDAGKAAEAKSAMAPTKEAKGNDTFVPPLFSGNQEGFPKLDDKTRKFLDGIRQKVAQNQPEGAVEDLETALKEDPNNNYIAVELAMMQSDLMKNPARADQVLNEALRRDPESKVLSAAYADYLSQHGREAEATPHFLRAAANGPVEASTQLGHHLMRLKDWDRAAESYQVAYDRNHRELQNKATAGESMLFAKQTAAMSAIDYAHAELKRGNVDAARQLAGEAQRLLEKDKNNPQLQTLISEIGRAAPRRGDKNLSE